MKIIHIILFFVIYHCVLNFFFKQINYSKLMSYIKKAPTLSILSFGILIPIFLFFLIFNFDEYKYTGFIFAISMIYTKFFFNHKILKNVSKN
jgi:hypothetical protein